jgi:hypothetical protein
MNLTMVLSKVGFHLIPEVQFSPKNDRGCIDKRM